MVQMRKVERKEDAVATQHNPASEFLTSQLTVVVHETMKNKMTTARGVTGDGAAALRS